MFDIGWSEMAVIALLTLIVIGPRELPRVLRTVGQWVRKAQSLAREFQHGLDDMAREADLEDAKKLVDAGRSIANPKKMVMDTLDPTGSVEDAARDVRTAMTAEPKSDETAGGAAEPSNAADGEDTKATMVKSPVNVAPPDSITPPREPGAEPTAKPKAKPEAKPKASIKTTAKTGAKAASNAKPKAKPKAEPKPKAKPRAKAKPEPAAAGSDGPQKTA